jgi:hypothetical protein
VSIREDIAKNIVDVLKDMSDPKPVLVTREFFEVEKLAITQFPAIYIQTLNETRTDVTMSTNRRQGFLTLLLSVFVRGVELDRLRNDIVERIEETLDTDRRRDTANTTMTTQVRQIRVISRLAPLGELEIEVEVRYTYLKGTT